MENRLQALEQRLARVERNSAALQHRIGDAQRQLRAARRGVRSLVSLAALAIAGAFTLAMTTPGATAEPTAAAPSAASNLVKIKRQAKRIKALETLLQHFSRTGNDIIIAGANLHLRNDAGATNTANGLGNLILGYNEVGVAGSRAGSHNLVVGPQHTYSSYAGIVAGRRNSITAPLATVLAGEDNEAEGFASSVTGGAANSATGDWSAVSGGEFNWALGELASVTGGSDNVAAGDWSTVSGGFVRSVFGLFDWQGGDLFADD